MRIFVTPVGGGKPYYIDDVSSVSVFRKSEDQNRSQQVRLLPYAIEINIIDHEQANYVIRDEVVFFNDILPLEEELAQ